MSSREDLEPGQNGAEFYGEDHDRVKQAADVMSRFVSEIDRPKTSPRLIPPPLTTHCEIVHDSPFECRGLRGETIYLHFDEEIEDGEDYQTVVADLKYIRREAWNGHAKQSTYHFRQPDVIPAGYDGERGDVPWWAWDWAVGVCNEMLLGGL